MNGSAAIGIKFSDDRIEEGVFVKDKLTGYGRIVYKDQSVYVGQVSDGLKQGQGRMTYADEKKLSTKWLNDKVDCTDAYKEVADKTINPIQYS